MSGVASRSHYAWGGATYQRYSSRDGDRRPDLLFYSFAYAYSPRPGAPTPGGIGEFLGSDRERSGPIRPAGLSGTESHQVFVGPTTLGVLQEFRRLGRNPVPGYRDSSSFYPRERVRFALNFAYFF